MPLPTKPKPELRRMHQETTSEAASSSSQLRAGMPPKRTRVEEEVQTNETMKDLNETKDGLERVRKSEELEKTETCGGDCSRIATCAGRGDRALEARI